MGEPFTTLARNILTCPMERIHMGVDDARVRTRQIGGMIQQMVGSRIFADGRR